MSTADLIADLILERLGSGDASHLIQLVSVRKALNVLVGAGLAREVDHIDGEAADRVAALGGSITQINPPA